MWQHRYLATSQDDGATSLPIATQIPDNCTIAIALVIERDGKFLILRSQDASSVPVAVSSSENKASLVSISTKDGGEGGGAWELATGLLEPNETIPNAAIRIARSECGVSFTPLRLCALENYPSLKRNWFRLLVQGEARPEEGKRTEAESELGVGEWVDRAAVARGEISLAGSMGALGGQLAEYAAAARHVSLPASRKDVGFSACLVELALVAPPTETDGKEVPRVLLVKAHADSWPSCRVAGCTAAGEEGKAEESSSRWCWTLPVTHLDRGETVGFAAGRLARAVFNVGPEAASLTLAHVEHNGRSDVKLEGLRFTVHAPLSQSELSGVGSKALPEHRWASASELCALQDDGTLRDDLVAILSPILSLPVTAGDRRGVPLLQVG